MKKLVINTNLPYGVCDFLQLSGRLLQCRAAQRLPKDAKSVICVLFPYNLGEDAYRGGNISSYAAVKDYHIIAGEYLERLALELSERYPGNSFVPFCDNSPLPEVAAAKLSGLGVTGKNGLLISPVYGSRVFIGEIVTDAVFEFSAPAGECSGCGKCIESCPSGALSENGVDRSLCLSAVTQKKGELSQHEQELIRASGCIWGCDVCQNVCMMNKNAAVTPIEEFFRDARASYEGDADISERAFAWRGRAVIQRNFELCDKK
ncbi:MAG: epoxyqueuosine reductase [Clostridiales bacterium]|nr:epoxyqueuosine reductase [Clostridiales bacterium]